MDLRKNWFVYLIAAVLFFALVKQCEQEPKVVTKTKVVYKDRTDTIHSVTIKEVPKKVYIERTVTKKGKDSIVYVEKPSHTSIKANQYDTELISNGAKAKLKVTTTGQLLDVSGMINWKEKETTTTTTITKPKSGLFFYGQTSVLPTFQTVGIGIDYQYKNTVILGPSVTHDFSTSRTYIGFKIGARIF